MHSASVLTILYFLILSFLGLVSSSAHDFSVGRRHPTGNALAERPAFELGKRFTGARFTYYDVTTGQTACGGWYKNSDFVVALSVGEFAGGSRCGQKISITINGKSATATVVDECAGCPDSAVDLTSGLFSFFSGLAAGELQGSWNLGGAIVTTSTTSKWVAPSTTTTTSTTHSRSSQSTTSTPPPQSSSSSSKHPPSSSSSSSSSVFVSSSSVVSSSTSSVLPIATIPSGTIGQLNLAVGGLGALIIAAARGY